MGPGLAIGRDRPGHRRVHSDRREDIEAAAEILRGEQPETLTYFDAYGKRVQLVQ